MFELLTSFHHLHHAPTTCLVPEEENSWHWSLSQCLTLTLCQWGTHKLTCHPLIPIIH